MKKVAVYDMDPTNGGLAKYSEIKDDAFVGVLAVPPLDSPVDFFIGDMLSGDPDAVVLDLPGNPLKSFGSAVSAEIFARSLFECRMDDYEPVPVYPMTAKTVSADSLEAALDLFKDGVFGVCFNEFGVPRVQLDSGRGFVAYERLAGRVAERGGIEYSLPATIGKNLAHAIDGLLMPLELGLPVGADGADRTPRERRDAVMEWLASRGVSSGDGRSIAMNLGYFLEGALSQAEYFVDSVFERIGDARPVFMPYSDKGGEGKSYMARVLKAYLRHYWANGVRYARAGG